MSKFVERQRIGVYVCHCGGNISDYVDVKEVVNAVKDYPGVVLAKDFIFMCSDAGQKMIEEDIKKHNLDGVVVAACSPKLHEMTFRNVVTRAGLNPFLFYHVNIREQSSWAHRDRKYSTKKAISHVLAGIEYVKLASALEKIRMKAEKSVLIIGGGIAGIRAALDLSGMGINVVLVEKEPFLGGRTARIWRTHPNGKKGVDVVRGLINELKERDNVVILTNSEVTHVEGFVGNFKVKVHVNPRYVIKNHPRMKEAIDVCPVTVPDEFNYGLTTRKAIYYPYEGAYPELPVIDPKACTRCGECVKIVGDAIDLSQKPMDLEFKVGAIVVTTGFKPYEPKPGEFGYKEYGNVITLPVFDRLLDLSEGGNKLIYNGKEINSIAFIYCVGSRQIPNGSNGKVNEYCSRYCCNATIYRASQLKRKYPHIKQYHFYRDIRTYGLNELLYLKAGEEGAVFIKYPDEEPPKVYGEDGKLIVESKDVVLGGDTVRTKVDLVVLVVGMEPYDTKKISDILSISTGKGGFLQEAHPKLRPVETLKSGIYIAGTAQAPRTISETLISASAASAKAASMLIKGEIELEPRVARVDPEKCNLSKRCVEVCPTGAISFKEYEGLGTKAWVNEAMCIGCGACTAVCPTEAIQLNTLKTTQIKRMIEAAIKGLER